MRPACEQRRRGREARRHGEAADRAHRGGCDAGRRGPRARGAGEPRAEVVDAAAARVGSVERDEHVERLHVLDDRRLQLAAERRQRALGAGGRPLLHERGSRRCRARGRRGPRSPSRCEQPDADDRRHEHDRGAHEGLHDPQRHVLQLVDVAHEPGEQVAAPVEARPSGAIGSIRSNTPERIVASWRNEASWPVSRSR